MLGAAGVRHVWAGAGLRCTAVGHTAWLPAQLVGIAPTYAHLIM